MAKRNANSRAVKRQSAAGSAVWVIALVVLVAVGAVVVIALSQQSRQGAPAASTTGTAERYAGIPHGVDADGFPRLGNPDARVVVTEISDFT